MLPVVLEDLIEFCFWGMGGMRGAGSSDFSRWWFLCKCSIKVMNLDGFGSDGHLRFVGIFVDGVADAMDDMMYMRLDSLVKALWENANEEFVKYVVVSSTGGFDSGSSVVGDRDETSTGCTHAMVLEEWGSGASDRKGVLKEAFGDGECSARWCHGTDEGGVMIVMGFEVLMIKVRECIEGCGSDGRWGGRRVKLCKAVPSLEESTNEGSERE